MFGVIRRFLVGKSWRNLDEFEKLVRMALSRYEGKVVVEVVTDTLDYKAWFTEEGVLNKNLSLFSRHGPNNYNPGIHHVCGKLSSNAQRKNLVLNIHFSYTCLQVRAWRQTGHGHIQVSPVPM